MTAFIESTRAMQINITTAVLLLLCFFILLHTQQHHHHAAFRHQIVGIGGSVLFFSVFVMLMFVKNHMTNGTEIPIYLNPIASAPVLAFFGLFIAGSIVLIYEIVYDVRQFHSYLSEYSILQAVNNLNDGLVIFDDNKRIVFANQKMHELSFTIFGQSLYRFVSFPEWIEYGFCAENVYCLPQFPYATYYLPSGEVWQIRRLMISVDGEPFHEFVASDITRQYTLRLGIEQENASLKKRQKLIMDSAKMIIENNVKEEQLAYKMRIHDSLGQCVTTVSHMMQESGDIQGCTKLWTEIVEGLRTYGDNEASDNEQRALREQLRLIAQFGCSVQHEGPLPNRSLHAQIFRDAIRTAAINAVRHAKADTLYVETKKEDMNFAIQLSDNGNTAPESLIEGGGLSSLRLKVERAGGEMKICIKEGVKIHIVLPPI